MEPDQEYTITTFLYPEGHEYAHLNIMLWAERGEILIIRRGLTPVILMLDKEQSDKLVNLKRPTPPQEEQA